MLIKRTMRKYLYSVVERLYPYFEKYYRNVLSTSLYATELAERPGYCILKQMGIDNDIATIIVSEGNVTIRYRYLLTVRHYLKNGVMVEYSKVDGSDKWVIREWCCHKFMFIEKFLTENPKLVHQEVKLHSYLADEQKRLVMQFALPQ